MLSHSLVRISIRCDRKLDDYGLSAIPAPTALAEMAKQARLIFGERAHALNIMVGEAA